MYYDREKNCIKLSVRELCGLALRGGNLDNRIPPVCLSGRAAEGREIHQALQARRSAGYHPEVTLRHVSCVDGVNFCVSGRADGVMCDGAGRWMVEEIKSLAGGDAYIGSPRRTDLAQLSCYGYFLCCAKELSSVTLRLCYAREGGKDETYIDSLMTVDALKKAYIALLAVILPRARDMVRRETEVRDVARDAVFPYPEMREAQRDMILECRRDMMRGETLFAQAPTGIGKTISTLYPAVRCWGEFRCDKIFYLTAKSSTRREAVGSVEKMIAAGTPLRATVIASREAMCVCEGARTGGGRLSRYCNPDACPYAKGYYDRVEVVIERMLARDGIFTPLFIRESARNGAICPYELSLDLSERCEIVICDYNYVFSPSVYLRRYFADGIPHGEGNRYIFLVDEAHNLADRAREMYSGMMSTVEIAAVREAFHDYESWVRTQAKGAIYPEEDFYADDTRTPLSSATFGDLYSALERRAGVCRETMVTDAEGMRRGVSLDRDPPVSLLETADVLGRKLDTWIRRNPSHPLYGTVDAFAASLRAFRTAAEYYDHRFATFTEMGGTPDAPDVRVSLRCLDPAGILGPILQKAEARVLFSATLTPADYFADILGGGRDSVCVSFDSPFPRENLCVAVADGVSTRYEDRERSYRRVVSYIAATVSAKKGNYMVYFPSYVYLEKVLSLFEKKYPKVKVIVQRPGMSAEEREAFIASFCAHAEQLQIGFCVLGGVFSEGVDLPGNSLIGAVIVGVGLPGLSNEGNIMKAYYEESRAGDAEYGGGTGYAYAYTYPGMNRVLQAAGRVIRTPEDKGVVVLIDDRYVTPEYMRLYPPHWEHMSAVGDPSSLFECLSRFWAQKNV